MATNTTNLNLIKPDVGEFYDIANNNSNNDIIDNAIGNIQNASRATFNSKHTNGMLIPMYVYPTDIYNNTTYNNLFSLAKKYSEIPIISIMNPNNGAGTSVDGNYTVAITKLISSDIQVIGYIAASYGAKSLASLKAEMQTWLSYYPNITGFFIDEVEWGATINQSYLDLYDYFKDLNNLTILVGNPGCAVPNDYFDAFDIVVIGEGTYNSLNFSSLAGNWSGGLCEIPMFKKSTLVHSTAYDSSNIDDMLDVSGWVYYTESTTPWSALPVDLEKLIYKITGTIKNTDIYDMETDIDNIKNASRSSIQTSQKPVDTFPASTLDGKVLSVIGGQSIAYHIYTVDVADTGTTSFSSISGDKYYDKLNNTIITGTGSNITITNNSGATSDMGVVHLNAYGLESKTASEMADITSQMAENTDLQHSTPDVETVNKNNWQNSKEVDSYYNTTLKIITNGIKVKSTLSDTWQSLDFKYKLKPNSQYTLNFISNIINGDSYVIIYNSQGASIGINNCTFTTDSVGEINLRFHCNKGISQAGEVDYTNIQLELGASATDRINFNHNLWQPQIPLRSLPNLVRDYLRNATLDGGVYKPLKSYEHEQNVEVTILDGSDSWAQSGSYSGYDRVVVTISDATTETGADNRSIATSDTVDLKYNFNAVWDLINEYTLSGGNFYVTIPDNTTDLTAYFNANPIVLQYQLATPIITSLTLDEIMSFADGTIYQHQTVMSEIALNTPINQGAVIEGNTEMLESLDDKIAILTDKVNVTNYAIKWNKTTDSYTRLNDAWGLTYGDDFSDKYPWSKMRRCNLADDLTVNAYYGDSGYVEDSSNGETMVQIPKFYYKTKFYTDGNGDEIREWHISEYAIPDYKLHPAFINAGIVKDYCYISAYEGYNDGGTLRSKIAVQPTDTQTISTFRTQAQVHGNGWGLLDFQGSSLVQLLYLVEYGDMYAQSVLSEGITNLDGGTVNHSQNTGHTSSLGNTSGEVVLTSLENGATGDTETYPFSYRGIENFYGNIWKFVDGILIKDDGYYIGNDIDNYSDAGTGYLKYNGTPIIADGYGKDFENLDNMDYGFMVNQVGGSSTTYTTDYFCAHDVGEVNIALLGASWYLGAAAGCFYWTLSLIASSSSRHIGARLLAR